MPQGNPFTSAMAPAAMAGIAPDLAADQTQLLRQQQLADLLRRQGMEPMGPTEMVSGWAVKKSPLEGVAKIAQALGGQYLASQADERQLALSQALQQRQLGELGKLFGDGQPSAGQLAQQWGDANGDSGPPNPAVVQAAQQVMPPSVPAGSPLRTGAEYAVKTGNNELLGKLIANFAEMTPDQKNWLATGRDPKMIGRMMDAELRAKGIVPLQAGTVSRDMMTGEERYVPKVGEGITLNSNGSASAVPGYADANAEIAGRQAGAVSGAQANYKPITVNTEKGPKMMTEGQVVEQAGGGTPLIDAVIRAESNGNQNAVSPKGAIGLGQIMPGTAKGLGGDPKNPVHNVAMAQTLLGKLQQKYGNDAHALAAYNWGEGNVDKWIKAGADPSKLPAETQKYIATVARLSGAKPAPGIPLKGTELPESAVKEQQALLEKVGIAGSTNADLAAIEKQIADKDLKLGPLTNLAGKAKNYLGMSDQNSRNLASFQATLEKLRNDSLRLNSGVQTEGDAQRAWKELVDNIGDEKLVIQRLQEIQKLNERAANLQQLQVDTLRNNFGAKPLDTKKAYNQPAAVGSVGKRTVDDVLKQYPPEK